MSCLMQLISISRARKKIIIGTKKVQIAGRREIFARK